MFEQAIQQEGQRFEQDDGVFQFDGFFKHHGLFYWGQSARRSAARQLLQVQAVLSETFAERDLPLCAYGDFSLVHLVFDYKGARPAGDDFIPYDGSVDALDGAKDFKKLHAFRQAMILNGVDLPGKGMFLTCEHTEADVEKSVEAVATAVEMIG